LQLVVNKTKEVDFNADGINDISILLNKLSGTTAYLTISPITHVQQPPVEQPPVQQPEQQAEPAAEEPTTGYMWIAAFVLFVIIAGVFLYIKKGKKRHPEETSKIA
jgi:choline-glycine betaine transporter